MVSNLIMKNPGRRAPPSLQLLEQTTKFFIQKYQKFYELHDVLM